MKPRPEFHQGLRRSQMPALNVVNFLKKQGRDAYLRGSVLTPNEADRRDYYDNGDIAMVVDGVEYDVECKCRNDLSFTCADDFPYDTVVFDEVHKVERRDLSKLWGYWVISNDWVHACFIPRSSEPYWVVENIYDKSEKKLIPCYALPKERGIYHNIQTELSILPSDFNPDFLHPKQRN